MISDILKNIFDGAILPMLLTAASVQFPILGIILRIPVLGNGIKTVVQWGMNWLLDKGVIQIKDVMIDQLTAEAKAAYAPQIALLREAQSQSSLTPEQEAEYEKRFQDIVKNHPAVVTG